MSGQHESCADFIDRIVYMLDNELEDSEVVAVRLHIDECGPCFEKYDVQRTIKMIVARSCSEPAPESLRDRVRVHLRHVQIQISEG
jgi:mycothiol system anti-sigma-R factor